MSLDQRISKASLPKKESHIKCMHIKINYIPKMVLLLDSSVVSFPPSLPLDLTSSDVENPGKIHKNKNLNNAQLCKKKKKKASNPKVKVQMQRRSGCTLIKEIYAGVGSKGICLLPK